MTAFKPIPPTAALTLLDGAEIDPRTLLADLAEAGIIKGYARLLKTVGPDGEREIRDCRIPREIWGQIIAHQKVDDVFTTNSVRIEAGNGSRQDGMVTAIGIRFDEKSIASAAVDHGLLAAPARSTPALPRMKADDLHPPAAPAEPQPIIETARASSARRSIPEGALQLTIEETMAALGIGRTTLYKLIGEGDLEMKKTRGRSHVTTESIRAFMDR